MTYYDPDNSGSRTGDILRRIHTCIICLPAGGLALLIAWSLGFPCWVVQQLFMLVIALEFFPFLSSFPGISVLHRRFLDLVVFYRRNPRFRGPEVLVVSWIPILGWLAAMPELKVMSWVVLIGLPIDVLLQALTTYVVPIHVWGKASEMGFIQSCLVQAFLTFLFTPFLVRFVLALRWGRFSGSAQGAEADENDDSDEWEEDEFRSRFAERDEARSEIPDGLREPEDPRPPKAPGAADTGSPELR